MALDEYNRKRKFDQTPEPKGDLEGKKPEQELLRFVVQMHDATRLHYDFRIEVEGVFKSWAVPKGLSLNAQDQRLAVFVEDHPIAYGSFEGIIPKGNYGAGTVMVWDEGTYVERNSKGRDDSETAVLKGMEQGHVTLVLEGEKLRGEFALVRLKDADEKSWLLIKKRDEFASYKDVTLQNRSVKTGRNIQEIAQQAPERGDIWLPARSDVTQTPHPAFPAASVPPSKPSLTPKVEKIPRRIKPMLATLAPDSFDQDGWIFEFDRGGLRTLGEVEKGSVHLYSKQHLSFNSKFPQITKALSTAKLTAVLDGTIVEIDNREPVYWVWDILHLNGLCLRDLPLLERKKQLQDLTHLGLFNESVQYSPHEVKLGVPFLEQARLQGFPGIFARDAYCPYISGTSKRWLKISAKTSASTQTGPRLTRLDKIYWPKDKITKGDLIDYYRKAGPILLPHLKDRPESLHRHPDGIEVEGFFQKDLVGHHPRWIHTERIFSESSQKSIDYLVCQNESTLLYMANLGCIELNPWLSRIGSLDRPDAIVIDLDPDDNDFSEVVEVAQALHVILEKIGAPHFCKTSGATGLHIFIPVQAKYSYETGRKFAERVCQVVHRDFKKNTSLERSPAKRRGKIYLDYLQNAQGQTVASVYCVRPRPGAPVSTPLAWEELKPSLRPSHFTIHNVTDRFAQDLFRPVLELSADLEACHSSLTEKYPMEDPQDSS